MGAKQSPDAAQEIMESLSRYLDETDVCIDHVGVFSNSWTDHLTGLRKALTILQSAIFTINPLKCEWAIQETDWLGCWLAPTGLKPWRKKIDAVLSMGCKHHKPSNSCDHLLVRSRFIVTCFPDDRMI
jgi:hypothetical protein